MHGHVTELIKKAFSSSTNIPTPLLAWAANVSYDPNNIPAWCNLLQAFKPRYAMFEFAK